MIGRPLATKMILIKAAKQENRPDRYRKATYGKEKVSDLFIIVTTADRNLIYKNKANTSSLT